MSRLPPPLARLRRRNKPVGPRVARPAFTLLEAVAALLLFTLCAGIVLQTLAGTRLALFNGLRGGMADADRRLVVRRVLTAPDRATALKDGHLTAFAGDRLSWRVEIEPAPVVDLHRVTIRLRRETPAGDTRDDTLVLHALRPAWSDPVERAAQVEALRAQVKNPVSGETIRP